MPESLLHCQLSLDICHCWKPFCSWEWRKGALLLQSLPVQPFLTMDLGVAVEGPPLSGRHTSTSGPQESMPWPNLSGVPINILYIVPEDKRALAHPPVHVLPCQVHVVFEVKDQAYMVVQALGPQRLPALTVRTVEIYSLHLPWHPEKVSLKMVGVWCGRFSRRGGCHRLLSDGATFSNECCTTNPRSITGTHIFCPHP